MYWTEGDTYQGNWQADLRSGKGTNYYDKTGVRFTGNFAKDKFNGEGTYFFKNGDRAELNYQNGIKEGKATFFGQNGEVIEANFVND